MELDASTPLGAGAVPERSRRESEHIKETLGLPLFVSCGVRVHHQILDFRYHL